MCYTPLCNSSYDKPYRGFKKNWEVRNRPVRYHTELSRNFWKSTRIGWHHESQDGDTHTIYGVLSATPRKTSIMSAARSGRRSESRSLTYLFRLLFLSRPNSPYRARTSKLCYSEGLQVFPAHTLAMRSDSELEGFPWEL